MTVASLVHSNVVRSHRSVYGTGLREQKKARKCTACVLVLFIFVFGFLYVFATNSIAAKGYKIRSLSKQVGELESTNKDLQVEISGLNSVNILEAKVGQLEMIRVSKMEYVSLPRTSAMLVK
jgi:cell division protein FtsB